MLFINEMNLFLEIVVLSDYKLTTKVYFPLTKLQ